MTGKKKKGQKKTCEISFVHFFFFFSSFHRALPIIHLGIVQEVKTTSKASTLFRGNSMSTKLMSAFTKHVGIPYLRETLGPLVSSVLKQDPSLFEVDPKHNPADPAANMERLKDLCLSFFNTIVKSTPTMPVPFRWMARILHDEVAQRFPDSKKTSVGGFLFLRFICPAMLSPEHHGLVDEGVQLTQEKRRPLTLVSKVLQNLSNDVSFGTKEAFLEPLNSLLTENGPKLVAFFDDVINVRENDDWCFFCLFVCFFFFFVCLCVCVCLIVCLFVPLICLFIYLFVCLFVLTFFFKKKKK